MIVEPVVLRRENLEPKGSRGEQSSQRAATLSINAATLS